MRANWKKQPEYQNNDIPTIVMPQPRNNKSNCDSKLTDPYLETIPNSNCSSPMVIKARKMKYHNQN